ncbi:PIG-L deacetylase family protein [Candidatus Viridilinea mediisalina]|uniref:GlcNAc-PI de-N-acetylase n=1 Tax=Candidatus Viridilinea mediisalina TaxID=2024553 RepID=A0A2A6RJ89_9CHLR|nr:PIG-L deacetylase family protein [Candidatus Viridilinea mediisalina]PDW03023.1 GlcNAc-PI de-N-acetylase [Candidatus Viridilinea mediisalina]
MSAHPSDRPRTALVIVAHPDDAEFACGATVAGWAAEGWQITLVVCTDGGSGGPDEATDVSPETRRMMSMTRKAEQRASAAVLGISEVVFLDYPDGQLEPTLALRRELVRQMRRTRAYRLICQSPDRVWTPSYALGRFHPDHLAAGAATLAAVYPAAQNAWDFPELLAEGYPPSRVRELYIVGAPHLNYAVDISRTIEIKLAALGCHVSQIGHDQSALATRIRQWAAERGEPFGLPLAESYHRVEN